MILGKLEVENDQSGKVWFADQNIKQSSPARQTANDDDCYIYIRLISIEGIFSKIFKLSSKLILPNMKGVFVK